jgi:hypothetical protein
MKNITIIENSEGIEQVLIDLGDDNFVSMSKEEYDRRQAEQSTPNLPN